MVEFCNAIECLSNSPQRLQILDELDDTYADLRDLKTELDSPRTTLQRNLSVLEKQGWVEKTSAGYTATTTGSLLLVEVGAMNETSEMIHHLAPFLNIVDNPSTIDTRKLNDPLITTLEPGQPHFLMKRLINIFRESNHVRGFLPFISHFLLEHYCRVDDGSGPKGEYVISSDAFAMLHQQYANDDVDRAAIEPPAHIDVRIYNGNLPYGLLFEDDIFVLAAYDEIGRIQVLVESTSEETIEWGERQYETYRNQSVCLDSAV